MAFERHNTFMESASTTAHQRAVATLDKRRAEDDADDDEWSTNGGVVYRISRSCYVKGLAKNHSRSKDAVKNCFAQFGDVRQCTL
jgi:hypothetical protein